MTAAQPDRADAPAVSVIIPNYNHARYVGQAIASALAQTYRDYEIVVIDDGSTDNSREVIAPFMDRVRYVWQLNQGLSAARNTGVRESRGRYIALLDADDIWFAGYLAALVALLEANPRAGAAYSGWRYIDANGALLPQQSTRTVPPDQFYTTLAYTNFLVPSGVLARRACLEQAGPFDVSLRAVEDRDMWLRIARHHSIVGVPRALVGYRTHGENMTRDLARMETARRQVIARHFGPAEGDPQSWPPLRRRAWGGLHLRTALDHFQAGDPDGGRAHLKQAFAIYPDVAGDVEAFYELGCANQPRGARGSADTLDIARNAALMMGSLDSVFNDPALPPASQAVRGRAYGCAALALGALAYNTRRFALARRYLAQAVRSDARLIRSARWRNTLAKAIVKSLTQGDAQP